MKAKELANDLTAAAHFYGSEEPALGKLLSEAGVYISDMEQGQESLVAALRRLVGTMPHMVNYSIGGVKCRFCGRVFWEDFDDDVPEDASECSEDCIGRKAIEAIEKAEQQKERKNIEDNKAVSNHSGLLEALKTARGLIVRHHSDGTTAVAGKYCSICHHADGSEPEIDEIFNAIAKAEAGEA